MSKTRLEAFSVLELKVSHGDDVKALAPLLPEFLT
jgi:hypothetical protein